VREQSGHQSLVLQAGAGTGKTHSLVELCIELLGGGLDAARLWAVTFTEKAAAELKGRLRERVGALAESDAAWRAVRRRLEEAQVGTIHSLCAQILRRHAAAAGIDPGFAQLDEAEGARLLREACESTALRALEGELGPETQAAARRLCAEMGLRRQGKFGAGLADELAALLGAVGEVGRLPPPAALAGALEDDARARRELAASMSRLRDALAAASSGGKTAQAVADAVAAFRIDAFDHAPGELAAAWSHVRKAMPAAAARGALAEPLAAAKAAWEVLLDADAGVRGAELSRDLSLVAGHAQKLHREEKSRAGALDFDDLTRLCGELLSAHPAALAAERERIGALLVDEFQDTSRAQLALLGQLASGKPLTVVGDGKQSIYEFRGADAAGAQQFARALLEGGAERRVLSQSRRSRPALVEFANLLFANVLGDEFSAADDALTAVRPGGPPGPCAELIDVVSGAGVEAEAELVARRIAAMLAPGSPDRVFDADEAPRPVRGGDVAVLLRRFTNLESFRRALLRRRIPHLVYRGRGFYQSREVQDLMALLGAAVDPGDALSLAAVLRSPFGPLSDDALVLLSSRGRIELRNPGGLEPDDAQALREVGSLLETLRHELDRLGPAALLEAALAETDYAAACAGGLYGEQAAANLEKLLALARAAELRGETVRAFLSSLRARAEEQAREPEAAVVEESDPHAVRLMTVHAAKGLEFPVVVVPECASPSAHSEPARVLLDAALGLLAKARGADGERRWGTSGKEAFARRREREIGQSRRLFYVAVTRARDLAVLSGRAARGQQETWRGFVDQVREEAQQRGLLRVLREVAAPEPAPPERAPVDPERLAELPRADHPEVRRIEAGAAGAAASLSVSVTQLADASLCSRRYQLLHELGLEEHPQPFGDAGSASAAALGTLAHRMLELLPLQLDPHARRAALLRLLALEGEDPAEHAEVLEAACASADSPLGQRMAKARPEHLRRELPFVLRLHGPGAPELLVRGQIDALLLEEKTATVVDYKLSTARDPARYAAQLDAYALAARELLQGALPVRAGIVFLRSKGAPFAEREPSESRDGFLQAGQAIAEGLQTGSWPKIAPERCRAIGCGFIRRCHNQPAPQPPF